MQLGRPWVAVRTRLKSSPPRVIHSRQNRSAAGLGVFNSLHDQSGRALSQYWTIVASIKRPARFFTAIARRRDLQASEHFVQRGEEFIDPTGNNHLCTLRGQ